ncbi:cupin domain-containing protein [Stutzerimonas stutzeri]|uniref:Cupin domain-containing protein n=1 Tax=Stutzerimonas stutzeri TaxID=316 RepID=A0A2N8T2A6_STUST|nr:cupin domain-containing protein [Stutzerimonas stutzeri]MCQ4324256.1 cupin domain-containing protein [Stutzerimonas stutzeri]PNG08843.1 cupin domain-containing protein [Stutzerimonas stutzeri]
MKAQRVVTGHDARGRSRIVSAGAIPGDEPFSNVPGFSAAMFWKTEAAPQVGNVQPDPPARPTSVLPGPGGTCAMLVTFPPEPEVLPSEERLQAAGAEMAARLPGLAELFEPDAPGFHRTDSIDYGVLLEGELTLVLDEGETTVVRAGDVLVQMGTRHAWRNTGNTPARMMFVMVHAKRV